MVGPSRSRALERVVSHVVYSSASSIRSRMEVHVRRRGKSEESMGFNDRTAVRLMRHNDAQRRCGRSVLIKVGFP